MARRHLLRQLPLLYCKAGQLSDRLGVLNRCTAGLLRCTEIGRLNVCCAACCCPPVTSRGQPPDHWAPLFPPNPPAGVVLPLLTQTILLWQVLLAATVLKKKLGVPQASRVCGLGVGVGADFGVDFARILVCPCMYACSPVCVALFAACQVATGWLQVVVLIIM